VLGLTLVAVGLWAFRIVAPLHTLHHALDAIAGGDSASASSSTPRRVPGPASGTASSSSSGDDWRACTRSRTARRRRRPATRRRRPALLELATELDGLLPPHAATAVRENESRSRMAHEKCAARRRRQRRRPRHDAATSARSSARPPTHRRPRPGAVIPTTDLVRFAR
jgi:hypothetical protein